MADPFIHGNYVNSIRAQLSSMNFSRLFFSTEMLTNGTVFVAGGKYGQWQRRVKARGLHGLPGHNRTIQGTICER